ncbi:MAG: glycosyltransferase [Rhodospirillales bacterium]|nr:MAG: glycosyltransferase [Rhodospirillales bacterium]
MSLQSIAKSTLRFGMARGYGAMARLGLYRPDLPPTVYLVERGAGWSIRWDGESYVKAIEAVHPGTVCVGSRPECLIGRTAHFGSQFVWELWRKALDPSNRVIVTYFHGSREDGPDMARHIDCFLEGLGGIDHVVTAAKSVERRLLNWGVPKEKLSLAPLGVDTNLFHPPSQAERMAARSRFGIPDDNICIGSFQKDGTGWGEGMEPKLIKGPDLFVDAVSELARDFPIHVLLTGPARGYVKRRLENSGIPFTHSWLQNFNDVATAFHALDLYLVTSREEGGPKAVLESLASGVPLVSSRVGMAEDVIENGEDAFICEVGDTPSLSKKAATLLTDKELRSRMQQAGRTKALSYDWVKVAPALFEVYRRVAHS